VVGNGTELNRGETKAPDAAAGEWPRFLLIEAHSLLIYLSSSHGAGAFCSTHDIVSFFISYIVVTRNFLYLFFSEGRLESVEETGGMARAKRPRTQPETEERGPVHTRKAGVFAVGRVPA
jgi:hypothetical protein